MTCAGKMGKMFLVLLNTIFLLFGLALLIVGIVFIFDSETLRSSDVLSVLNEVSFSGSVKLGNVMFSLPIYTICLAALILLVSGIGILGACCQVRWMLILYALIVVVFIISQGVCIALWITMKDTIKTTVRDELIVIMDNYEGYDNTVSHQQSSGWNSMFIGLDCCSVDEATSTNDKFANSKWAKKGRGTNKIPVSCCKSATKKNYKSHSDDACTKLYTNSRKKGCYEQVKDHVDTYETPAIVFCAILILTEIIAVIAAIMVFKDLKHGGTKV